MKGAFGALGWTPKTFWRSTVTEYFAAIDGFNEANGRKQENMPTDADVEALAKRYG